MVVVESGLTNCDDSKSIRPASRDDIKDLDARSFTPLHEILQELSNGGLSAEVMKAILEISSTLA